MQARQIQKALFPDIENDAEEVKKSAAQSAKDFIEAADGRGEIILYSPAFSSFGKYFKNEYDRGDKFMKIVKSLK